MNHCKQSISISQLHKGHWYFVCNLLVLMNWSDRVKLQREPTQKSQFLLTRPAIIHFAININIKTKQNKTKYNHSHALHPLRLKKAQIARLTLSPRNNCPCVASTWTRIQHADRIYVCCVGAYFYKQALSLRAASSIIKWPVAAQMWRELLSTSLRPD